MTRFGRIGYADTMSTFTHVTAALFVLDGVAPAPEAARFADRLFDDDVAWTILAIAAEHPSLTSGATGFAGPVLSPDEMDEMARADRVEADAATAATATGFGARPVHHEVARGDAVDAVVHRLEDRSHEITVVSSPDLARDLLAAGVTPILVVPAIDTEGLAGPVLVGVDGSELDERVVVAAEQLLGTDTTDYLTIHIEPVETMSATRIPLMSTGLAATPLPYRDPSDVAETAREIAEEAADRIDSADVEAIGSVGDPVNGLLDAAAEHDAALIVLGGRDRGWFSGLLQPSVAKSVLERAGRPVLLIG